MLESDFTKFSAASLLTSPSTSRLQVVYHTLGTLNTINTLRGGNCGRQDPGIERIRVPAVF